MVEWEPWIKGENPRDQWGRKVLTCRNPCPTVIRPSVDPEDYPSQAEATRRVLAAAEWDQGVEQAAWVHLAVQDPSAVWVRVVVWNQRVAQEAADDS